MKIIDRNTLFKGDVEGSILIKSFEEYKAKGGKHDMLDTYAEFKKRAESNENIFIMACDQYSSGIDVDITAANERKLLSLAYHKLLHLWFNK
jgi:hypothetical protein